MKTLWTFGCSFTAEYYPVDHKFIRSHYDDYKDWRGGTLPDVWPTLLGKKLNLEVKNMAFGGDSNYSIFDQFLNVVDLIREGDMVIFGWTHVVRFQAANPDSRNGFNQILPSITDYPETGLSIKTVEEILVNRSNSIWIKEVLNWIKFINLYMEKSKINIFHWTSDTDIFNKDSDFIDDKRFIVVKDENQPNMILGYLSEPMFHNNTSVAKIIEETNGEVSDCHFGEYGHKVQSKYFYEHIINNLQYKIDENRG
jgi:hypothetical protein